MKCLCRLEIEDMATVRSFELISDKFNIFSGALVTKDVGLDR
jgi:hypothetical protein